MASISVGILGGFLEDLPLQLLSHRVQSVETPLHFSDSAALQQSPVQSVPSKMRNPFLSKILNALKKVSVPPTDECEFS